MENKEIGIYVHIPFCKQKCYYCDFISYCNKDNLIEDYIQAVKKEIELQKIKSKLPQSIMSGSGSTYFVLENLKDNSFGDDYQIISGIKFIGCGIY